MQNRSELDQTTFELNQRLQESQREREQLQGDLAQAREEVRRVSDAMQIENQKQINEVREKMLLEQAEMQSKFDTEIKDARKRHETQHEEMQKKYEQLNDSNQKVLN